MINFIIMMCLLIIVRKPLIKYSKGVYAVLRILYTGIKNAYLQLSGRN